MLRIPHGSRPGGGPSFGASILIFGRRKIACTHCAGGGRNTFISYGTLITLLKIYLLKHGGLEKKTATSNIPDKVKDLRDRQIKEENGKNNRRQRKWQINAPSEEAGEIGNFRRRQKTDSCRASKRSSGDAKKRWRIASSEWINIS